MIKQKTASILLMIVLASFIAKAQVSVVNIQLMPYNVTPEAMVSASIMNSGAEQQVEIVSTLYNSNNELLFTVRSSTFTLKAGLNGSFDGSRKIIGADYTSNNQSIYIRTTHGLSSGTFKICVEIILTKTSEPMDQFCEEIESDFNQYLYLVYPPDNDSIETLTPILVWSHSEPFNVLSQTEYFRVVVSEVNVNQSAEEAVITNTPLMAKNYLGTHTLQYPYDAKQLQKGKQYAWQVQKLSNGVIINKTEAWKFSIIPDRVVADNKYASLKKTLDAAYYTAENNKVFFKFEEEYVSGNISCIIYDSKRTAIQPTAKNEGVKTSGLNFKQNGYNRYEINLNELDIKKGFYTLEAKNEKGELFLLKFYVQ
jgi:hypothetical protein